MLTVCLRPVHFRQWQLATCGTNSCIVCFINKILVMLNDLGLVLCYVLVLNTAGRCGMC